MPTSTVEGGVDFTPDDVRDITSFGDPLEALAPAGHLGTREEIEAELDMIAASMRTFHRIQPDQVMRYCAGYTARLTELVVLLHRVESSGRAYTRLRTMQVQKYIDQLEFQFKVASRMVEVMRQDLVLSGAQT